MGTFQITTHRVLRQGHHCWDVRINDQVVRKDLTKKQAIDWKRDHEKPLKAIIGGLVAGELERVIQYAKSSLDGWRS